MLKDTLNCKVIGITNNCHAPSKEQLMFADEIISNGNYEKVLSTADFVLAILPKNEKTNFFFNLGFFKKMKASSVFINIGRGSTVIEDDLLRCLDDGMIYGAALDVYSVEPLPPTSKLWEYDNVLMTFHSIGVTVDFWERIYQLFAEELMNFIEGKPSTRMVDIKAIGY